MTTTATPSVAPDAGVARTLRRPGLIERVIAVGIAFVYAFSLPTEWFVAVGRASAGTVQSGSPLVTLTFLSFLGIVILAFNGNWHVALAAAGREPLIPALMMLIGLSTLWSVNPIETFTSAVVIGITMMVGYYFATRFTMAETLYLTGIALAIGVVINFLFIFAFQQFGLDTINVGTDGGAKWSGIFVTKNGLGRIAALSFMIFAFVARNRRSLIVWPMWTLLAAIQVIGSDSATSLGAAAGLVVLTVVVLGFRGRKTLYGATSIAIVTVMTFLTLLAATNLAVATGLLGKDTTFTGRLPLWIDSWQLGISERLLTGYGWVAYWTEDVSFPVRLRANFEVPHAHNAFLDAWLYAGPLAAGILFAIYVRGMIWGARHIRTVPNSIGLAPIVLVSYAFIFSLTEAGVVSRDLTFVLLVVACTTAAQNKGRRRPWIDTAESEQPLMGHPG